MLDMPNQCRFDFSTIYTSVPHDLLKSHISTLIQNPLGKNMGVLDTHTLKSMAGEDILVTQLIQEGTKHTVQTNYAN